MAWRNSSSVSKYRKLLLFPICVIVKKNPDMYWDSTSGRVCRISALDLDVKGKSVMQLRWGKRNMETC